jgi:uncharacterized protein YndB with AHSA1/START domain
MPAENEIVLSRVFDAPRDLVFEAYTKPKHLEKWWGPRGFSITVKEMAFEEGGRFRFTMHGPDGRDYPNVMTYQEIIRPEKIHFLHGDDENPTMMTVTLTFLEEGTQGTKTRVTQRTVCESVDFCKKAKAFGAVELGRQTMDKLGEYLVTGGDPVKRQVLIERTFAAPRADVYQAWLDAKSLERWFAPADCRFEVLKMDARTGGRFHWVVRDPRHGDCYTCGEFLDIAPGERIVFSWSNADEKGNRSKVAALSKDGEWPEVMTVTVSFADDGKGGTRLSLAQTVLESLARKTGAYPSWLSMLDKLEGELEAAGLVPRR